MEKQSVIKKGVLNNKHYTLKPEDCLIKLNQNESPFDLPDDIKTRILHKLSGIKWNLYPDFIPTELYEKIASHLSVNSDNILIGNGSNEMINTILCSSIESGKRVIMPVPTFTVYNLISSNLNGDIVKIELNQDMSFPVDRIAEESAHKGSVTIICSPNNPTGSLMNVNEIKTVLKRSNGLVVIDEAYIHFGGESVISLIKQYDNLVVLRTFSKAYGLAGLRIGVMITNSDLITEFSKVKLPYNINIFTINTLLTILETPDYINKNIQTIIKSRDQMYQKLNGYKFLKVYPSSANFFLIKVKNSADLFNYLKDNNILIRDVSSYQMLTNHLRISVGSEDENNRLYELLENYNK